MEGTEFNVSNVTAMLLAYACKFMLGDLFVGQWMVYYAVISFIMMLFPHNEPQGAVFNIVRRASPNLTPTDTLHSETHSHTDQMSKSP